MTTRIAIFTNSFSAVGGAENSTQSIARLLQSQGWNVTVYVPLSERAHPALLDEFRILPVPEQAFRIDFPGIWFSREQKRAACRELAGYDVVLFCMLQSIMGLFPYFHHPDWVVTCRGADIQNPRKTPYRRLVQNSPYGIKFKGFRSRLSNEIFLRVFMTWARKKGMFVSISEDMVNELVALGVPRQRTRKILNGVDLERFARIQEGVRVSGRDPGKSYVLCVGRNDSRKGFYILLDAARELRRRGREDIRFVVKGRGFEKFLGFVTSMELQEYFTIVDLDFNVDFEVSAAAEDDRRLPDVETVALYRFADVVVIPSIIEALSNVGLEAEASGKPLIVADTFGCREYILRGTALGFEVGSGTDLAATLLRLLESESLRRDLESARERCREGLSVEHCVEAYAGLLRGRSPVACAASDE